MVEESLGKMQMICVGIFGATRTTGSNGSKYVFRADGHNNCIKAINCYRQLHKRSLILQRMSAKEPDQAMPSNKLFFCESEY